MHNIINIVYLTTLKSTKNKSCTFSSAYESVKKLTTRNFEASILREKSHKQNKKPIEKKILIEQNVDVFSLSDLQKVNIPIETLAVNTNEKVTNGKPRLIKGEKGSISLELKEMENEPSRAL